MKRRILLIILSLSVLLCLCACKTEVPGGTSLSALAGCYSLVDGRLADGDTTVEDFDNAAAETFVLKLKENGEYLIKFGGTADRGTASLDGDILTLSGALSPFDKYGTPTDSTVDFSASDAICRVNISTPDGRAVYLECTLRACGNYDDSFFEPSTGGRTELRDVTGIRPEGYPSGGFDPSGIELVFTADGEEERVPLSELGYDIEEHGSIGKVTVEYRGEEFSFSVTIASVDISSLLSPVTTTYTPDGYTYEPTLPSGYEFRPDGNVYFVDAGDYTVRGEVFFGGNLLGSTSVEIKIRPATVSDYPREIELRADDNDEARIPQGTFAPYFIYNDEVFYRGSSSLTVFLDGNHVFESGEQSATVQVTVLARLVSASRFEWIIPTDKVEFSYEWREMMPYLALDGEPLHELTYSYTQSPGEMGYDDFVPGYHTVTADFSEARFEPDGALPECTVELVPMVLDFENNIKKIYTGYAISVLPDFVVKGYAYVEGEFEASDIGTYLCSIRIESSLFDSGLVTFADGSSEKELSWSISKEKITLMVNDSAFDCGFDFEFDGAERRLYAYANAPVDIVMYVNGVKYTVLSDFFFRTPGTYNVRIEVEDENLDADPYETTVNISKKRITLSELGLLWHTGTYTYNTLKQTILIDPNTLPEYLSAVYENNEYTDSGDYTATATFKLKEGREEHDFYVITDPEFTLSKEWTIERAVISKPSLPLTREYTYNGSKRTFFSATGLPSCTLVSGFEATDAGEYTLTVKLSGNYMFADGTDAITVDWAILRKVVKLSSLSLETDSFIWSKGNKVYPFVYNLDNFLNYYTMTVTGDDGAEEPGDYETKLTFVLKDEYKKNYRIENYSGTEFGNSFEYSYSFRIAKRGLEVPKIVGSYYYTGAAITPTLSGFDSELMRLYAENIKSAGEHTVTIALTDPSHYYLWDDESEYDEAADLTFTVNKSTLTLGAFSQPITVYDGKSHAIELFYNGVGGEKYRVRFTLEEDGMAVESVLGAGYYQITVLGPADAGCLQNYETPVTRYLSFNVDKATIDFSKLVWSFDEVVYDGNVHIPTVSGYPSELTHGGVFLTSGSDESRAGIHAFDGYVASVRFNESENYKAFVASHSFVIRRRPVTPPVAVNTRFVYDGTQKALQYVLNDSFGNYDCTVSNYAATNASVYSAMFIAGDDFIFKVGESEQSIYTITWEITKGVFDLSAIKWNGNDGGTYKSDGTVYNFTLSGLPQWLEATYSMNGVQRPGNYVKVATLVNKNPDNMHDPDSTLVDLAISFVVESAVYGDYSYYVEDDLVYITDYLGTDANVVLPELISGRKISSVGSAFKNHSEIISLDISSVQDRWSSVDRGGLYGLTQLCELYLPGIDDGIKLSDLFGSAAPESLVALHLRSVAYEFMVKDIDSPYIKELYMRPSSYIDFKDIPFELRLLHLSYAGSTEIFNYDSVIRVPCLYNGSYKFARGSFDYPFYFSPVEFTAGIKEKDTHRLVTVDGFVYLLDGSSLTLMHVRSSGNVTIPAEVIIDGVKCTVTGVAKSALSSRSDIHTLTVPETVESVGTSAFSNLTGLKTLYWNAKSADGAGSISIKKRGEVIIGSSVLTLPDSFLADSHGLFEVVIPDSVVGFGKDIFKGSKNLLRLTLSRNLDKDKCGQSPFTLCSKLVDVYDPAGVAESIGLDKRSTDVVDPNNVFTRIYYVFTDEGDRVVYRNSDGFWLLDYGEDVTFILGYDGDAVDVSLPSTDRTLVLAAYAFYRNETIKTVDLTGISKIDVYAFSECSSLTGVTLSSSLVKIASEAFSSCTSLASISLPDSVTEIGSNAFKNCVSLESFRVPLGTTALPYGLLDGCKNLSLLTVHSSVKDIGSMCFYGCESVKSFAFPASLERVGEAAFSGTGLTFLELPAGIVFDRLAFSGSALVEVQILYGVTELADQIFSECLSLKRVILPTGFLKLGGGVFSGCTSLVTVSMPNSVTEFGNQAFFNCENLALSTLPSSLLYIGESAFSGCATVNFTDIPSGVWYIGASAFAETGLGDKNSDGLWIIDGWIYAYEPEFTVDTLAIPDGIVGIAGNAFRRTYMDSVVFSDTVRYVMPYAFMECTMSRVTLSTGIKYIGAYAFGKCENLTEVSIPNSVTEICGYAFSNCTSLTKVSIGSGVMKLGAGILNGCGALESVGMTATAGWKNENGAVIDLSTNEKRIEHFTTYTMTISK